MNHEPLTAVSLFAGVGGFDIAAKRAGMRVVAAVEIDPHARGVLAHKFPQTHLFDDVRTVTPDALRSAGFIPERGVILGGFPCQDLSVAGKRSGLAGERSGLFWEIVRLARDLNPRWLVLENVPGLLSSNRGRDMGTVLGALGDLGYGFAYRVLDAQHFGVPQRRRRVFIVGCAGDDGRASSEVLAIGEGRGGDTAAGGPQGQDTPAEAPRCADGGRVEGERVVVHHPEPIMGTLTTAFGEKNYTNHQEVSQGSVLAYTVQDRPTWWDGADTAATLTVKSNDQRMPDKGQLPVVIIPIGEPTREDDPSVFDAVGVLGERAHALTAEGSDASEDGTGRGTPVVAYNLHSGSKRADRPEGGFYVKETEIARTLDASGGLEPSKNDGGLAITQTIGAETTPAVLMRNREGKPGGGKGPLLSVEKSLTIATGNDQILFHPVPIQDGSELDKKQNGHGIAGEGSPAYTLDTVSRPAVAYNSTCRTIVRRLTPTECERLQGFPDGWTAERIDHKTGQVIEQKDASRYKQMGNAVAVPCVEWILNRLATTHHELEKEPSA